MGALKKKKNISKTINIHWESPSTSIKGEILHLMPLHQTLGSLDRLRMVAGAGLDRACGTRRSSPEPGIGPRDGLGKLQFCWGDALFMVKKNWGSIGSCQCCHIARFGWQEYGSNHAKSIPLISRTTLKAAGTLNMGLQNGHFGFHLSFLAGIQSLCRTAWGAHHHDRHLQDEGFGSYPVRFDFW